MRNMVSPLCKIDVSNKNRVDVEIQTIQIMRGEEKQCKRCNVVREREMAERIMKK